jgi:HTH-type transcriptional regulator/antitoxin HigA
LREIIVKPSEGERPDVPVTLVGAYECKHCPLDPPEPVEVVKFHTERGGMPPKDLQSL